VLLGTVLVLSWDAVVAIVLSSSPNEFNVQDLASHPVALLALLAFTPMGFFFPHRSELHSFVTLVHSTCLLVPVMFLNAPLAMMAASLLIVPTIIDLHLNLTSFTVLAMLATSPLAYVTLLGLAAGDLEGWLHASTGHVTQQVLVLGLVAVPVHWTLCSRACATV
jgi:hypothetical protein